MTWMLLSTDSIEALCPITLPHCFGLSSFIIKQTGRILVGGLVAYIVVRELDLRL